MATTAPTPIAISVTLGDNLVLSLDVNNNWLLHPMGGREEEFKISDPDKFIKSLVRAVEILRRHKP